MKRLSLLLTAIIAGCTSISANDYAVPARDEVLIYIKLVDEVYLDGVRVAEKTSCRNSVCMVELERATYLDCAAHAVAHAFAYNFHDPKDKTSREYCRNWRLDR